MSKNTQDKDIRTLGYVLRRTNYGEADRILNILTKDGKISAIAKGVRKEKSKLAGNIEMFTLVDFNLHKGKSDFSVVTGAKMIKHYGEIVKDFDKMELAAMIFKKVSKAAESSDNPEYFKIVDQSLAALNQNISLDIVKAWFLLNLKKAMGEEINLYRDINGEKLSADKKYSWDNMEMVFVEDAKGGYGADEIKLLRLIVSNDLVVVQRVKMSDGMMMPVLRLAQLVV